jgi:hypothetical protein
MLANLEKLNRLLERYERAELDEGEVCDLFQVLIDSGLIMKMRADIIHAARQMVDLGYLRGRASIGIGGK